MFNVTIIKLKDIIKIGVILILIYVFSNFVLKNFKIKSILNTTFNFNSVNIVETGIEKQSNIMKSISKEKRVKTDENKWNISKDNDLFDIESILNVGSNFFSLKQDEKINGQEVEQNNR